MPSWLDFAAYELLCVQAELRQALRAITRHGGPSTVRTRGGRGWQTLTLGLHEVRALLRGAMPAPIAANNRTLREPVARVVVALDLFNRHLLALNDPAALPEATLPAAAALADALAEWQRSVGRVAGRRYKAPRVAGRAGDPLPPDAHAGFRAAAVHDAMSRPVRELARAAQEARDSDDDEPIDLRQGFLPLTGARLDHRADFPCGAGDGALPFGPTAAPSRLAPRT